MSKITDYNKVINLINKVIPLSMDKTPRGKFVKNDSNYGEKAYFENEVLTLNIMVTNGSILLAYYSEDDYYIYLDGGIDNDNITEKELIKIFENEFGKIYKRFI